MLAFLMLTFTTGWSKILYQITHKLVNKLSSKLGKADINENTNK